MPLNKFKFSLKDFLRPKTPAVATSETEEKFSKKMKEIELKEKERETKFKAEELNLPYFNLTGFPISPESLELIPEEKALELKVICFYNDDRTIKLGAVNPQDLKAKQFIKEFSQAHHRQTQIYLISQESFNRSFKLYASLPKIKKVTTGVEISEKDFKNFQQEIRTFKDLERKIKTVSLTQLVTLIIAAAISTRASDVHLEAEQDYIKIRFRIDGVLHDVAVLTKEMWPKVIARIKLLAKLKINVTGKPQDGRFTIFLTEEKIDVRVSALPTTYGESVVMRLLMSSAIKLTFEKLGLTGKVYEDLLQEIQKPNGMVITTGPTGSGKTTTMYAILTKLNTAGIKIVTIEDPIEYRLEGISQSQVDVSKNYTFASGLRSILRQDPDIVMVGEIRDLETADIAINAALTGHAVFSTLHTNDASGSVPRLLAMGVKPFLLAPALNAMVGQRLVRRLCPSCKEEINLDKTAITKVEAILKKIPATAGFKLENQNLKFYHGRGCPKCQGLGYWGRVGIFEVMTMNPEVEQLILAGRVSEYDMLKVAVKHGMVTMVQDGLLKALAGITTVEEIFRVAKVADYEAEVAKIKI